MNEKELMLTSILKCEREDLYLNPKTLDSAQEQALAEMQKRRQAGEPLQYILGKTRFLDFDLRVTEGVLIPRPETELLVDAIVKETSNINRSALRILDLGTGSGNIAISLASYIPQSQIVAIDISPQAIKLSEENARKYDVRERISFRVNCLLEFLNRGYADEDKFDIIVSNPPYIADEQMGALPEDVKREPTEALAAGAQGLKFLKPIIELAGRFLKTDGILALEFGDGQVPYLKEVFVQAGYYSQIVFGKDYTLTDRYVIARKL